MLEKITMRITLTDLYLGVICVFPIATVLIDESFINKLLFAVLIAVHIGMNLFRPIRMKTGLLLLVLVANYTFALINTNFPLENMNLLFYYPFYLLYTYYLCDHKDEALDWFTKHRGYVLFITLIWTAIVGVSIFFPGCYYVKEGESQYFGSFCGTIFRLGQAAVFIQVLAILIQLIYGMRGAIIFHIVPMYCYFMGSSRTYLVVGLCIFAIAWYMYCKKKVTFWFSVVPMVIAVLAVLSVSAMADKIAYTLDEDQFGDFWFRITSSRSVLWEMDLQAYSEASLWKQIFGCGLEFTVEVSGKWGHNDFIEIICSFGIMGLVQYLFSIWHQIKIGYGRARVPVPVRFCAWMAWFFNAFFNMHYVYFCAMLCYPLLLFAIGRYYENHSVSREPKNQRV
jgi:hypothetical protein